MIPLAPIDLELSGRVAHSDRLPARFLRARVLVRWHDTPVGIVHVSVRSGHVWRDDVLHELHRQLPSALPSEAVRQALLATGLPPQLSPSSTAHPTLVRHAPAPRISVIVCTRDRPDDLAACLAALAKLDPPPSEVIVVDNAPSTDASARLVRDRHPLFNYVLEPRAGLDHARNRGIAAATGDVLAFTDDDVVVDPHWVGAIAAAFAAEPSLGLLTGLAEPLELESRAQLLFERYGGFGRGCRRTYSQASADRPLPWTLVGAGQLGAGANMAVRRDVFARIGLFDPALDVGTPTLGGGDHDLFFRVLRAGFLCVYEPAAVVRHRHRRTFAELRRLLYCYGHATRCFFDREALNFPSDRAAIDRLRRWWWKEWAWRRALRASFRPPWIPASLVFAEIKGFVRARGAYLRARSAIVRDETTRPDQPRPNTEPPRRLRNGIGIFVVNVAKPLTPLTEAANYSSVEILVQWHDQPIGTVRLANFGQPLSPRRLADEISPALWHRLLQPAASDEFGALVRFREAFHQSVSTISMRPAAAVDRDTTLVVTTCNRPDELRRCLQSIAELRSPRLLQVIVVDNRPDLGLAAPVVREFPGFELIGEHRPGSSYARNSGIAAARGEFIAMVDDDMRVSPRWLDRLLAPFARADVMAVTGNTLPASLETEAERLMEVYGGFGRGFVARDFDSAWFHRHRWRAVPTWQIGGSGNAAFRRRVFREVATFDETLGAGVPTGVGEDTKLFYDILHADFTVAYEPAATAWHYHRITLPGLRRQLYAYSKGHVAYHLRTWFDHRDARALVRICAELPLSFLQRARNRLRGRYAYPWKLLAVEIAGTVAGPWSLWRAQRLARRRRRQAIARSFPLAPASATRRVVPVLEAQP